MTGFLKTYAASGFDLQSTFDAAVVIPTICRPQLAQALRSVFTQDFDGRIQVLIGIDKPEGDPALIEAVCAELPAHCAVQVYYPGYSTSVRHGGVAPARDGGVLRCVLSYLANTRYIAYLDDDNWWRRDHLRLLRHAIEDADWAYALRWFVHPESHRPVAIDDWESVGPDRGVFRKKFGGFVDTNCLMIDRMHCGPILSNWNRPLPNDAKGMSADRNIFDVLRRNFRCATSGEPTVFYRLDPQDLLHPMRLTRLGLAYEEMAFPASA
ncbi:MAG TPA: glycosyltransferase family 2 protein [Aliidongia sp.]|nr:glycosyltransferase family 2 protein [Aliidongia sp.]